MTDVAIIELDVVDAPTGKGRPQFNRKTGRAYTPAPTRNAETHVRAAWIAAGSPRLPDDQALCVETTLYLERPLGHRKRDGTLSAEGLRNPQPYRKKPDVDNAEKLILDALEGHAYRRDVAIVDSHTRKQWCRHGERQHTRVRIWTADNDQQEAQP